MDIKIIISPVPATPGRPAVAPAGGRMGCYVDVLQSYPDRGYRYTEFCHLLADDRGELHAMADRLGMPRRFFQDHPVRWHYDLPEHLRQQALRLGAVDIDRAAVAALLRARRAALPARPANHSPPHGAS